MAESYVDKVANELADMALADQAASGDVGIVDMIGEVLGASSQTLQETYLTAVRVRRAEARARELLSNRAANGYRAAPKPKPAPLQHTNETEAEDTDQIPQEDTAEPVAPIDNADEKPATPATQMPRRVTR